MSEYLECEGLMRTVRAFGDEWPAWHSTEQKYFPYVTEGLNKHLRAGREPAFTVEEVRTSLGETTRRSWGRARTGTLTSS